MKIEVTEPQIVAIIELANDIEAMVGVGGESDKCWVKYVRLVDRMLAKNGLKRKADNIELPPVRDMDDQLL